MKNRTLFRELLTVALILCCVTIVFAANSVTTTGFTRNAKVKMPPDTVMDIKFTGIMNTGNSNLPSDSGREVPYLFNYGWCVFEREGDGILNVTAQKAEYPGSSSTLAWTNATNMTGIDVNNSTSTYAFYWADDGGDWFRLQLNTGFDISNQITNTTCHVTWQGR